MNVICSIYKHSNILIRKLIEKCIKKIDGGEFSSIKLRKLYKEIYGVEIGLGTYGCFHQDKYKHIKNIGNYTSIASGLDYFSRNHPIEYASTHPYFYNTNLKKVKENKIKYNNLVIGNDVWIGKDVKITNKCKYIGNGAIIGAGTIVTKNIEPYDIVVGIPGKTIKKRFDNETIDLLEKSKWYEMNIDELMNFQKYIDNPKKFALEIINFKNNLENSQ